MLNPNFAIVTLHHVDNVDGPCKSYAQVRDKCRRHGPGNAGDIIGGIVNESFISQTNGGRGEGGGIHQQEPPAKRPRVINTFSGGAGPSTAAGATPSARTPASTTAGAAAVSTNHRYRTRSRATPNNTDAASGPTLPHSELRGRQEGQQGQESTGNTQRMLQGLFVRGNPASNNESVGTDWSRAHQLEETDDGYVRIQFSFDGVELLSNCSTGIVFIHNEGKNVIGAIRCGTPAYRMNLKVGKFLPC